MPSSLMMLSRVDTRTIPACLFTPVAISYRFQGCFHVLHDDAKLSSKVSVFGGGKFDGDVKICA